MLLHDTPCRFLGSIFVFGASIGHSTNPRNPLLVVMSMGFVVSYTFVPLTHEFKVLPSEDGYSSELNTYKTPDGELYNSSRE